MRCTILVNGSLNRLLLLGAAAALWMACGDDDAMPVETPDTSMDTDVSEDGDGGVDAGDADPATDTDNGDVVVDADATDALIMLTAEEALGYVDPFIGSGGLGFGYSGLTPAAQLPNGFVKVGPDTSFGGSHPDISHFSGYNYDDIDVRGFSHVRLIGTGAADLGILRFLPVAELPNNPRRVWTALDKSSEQAEPGWYSVRLSDEDVVVEVSPTAFGAIHRYTFGDVGGYVILDPTANIFDRDVQAADISLTETGFSGSLQWQGSFTGRTRPFVLWFDAEVQGGSPSGTWDGTSYVEASEQTGTQAVGVWRAEPNETVEIRIGVSLLDAANASTNLEQGPAGRSLEDIRAEARLAWVEKMEHFSVNADADPDLLERFYTGVYNLYRMPSRIDEPSGQYRGLDGEIHDVEGIPYYTDLSLWDSFRTLHPLYEWIEPEMEVDILHSLMRMGDQYGRIPRWPAMLSETGSMVGTPADQLFAGAATKGLEGIDYDAAFEQLVASLTDSERMRGGRDGYEDYQEYGYHPVDLHDESVSLTLEYAWSDFSLANLAEFLGRNEDAALYREQSSYYRNVYNPRNEVFWPRNSSGDFLEPSSLTSVTQRSGYYTEGSAWHWRFYTIHDAAGLVELLGSAEELGNLLEASFSQSGYGVEGPINTVLPDPYYWHGNQPPIGNVYLFHATDRPERMGYWIRQIQLRGYGSGPDGIPGNDDGGTMSAWFVFSALGMHPIAGSDQYILGAPLFERVEVRSPAGTTVITGGNAAATVVEEVQLNGVTFEQPIITHAELVGSTLDFTMR